MIYFTGMLIGFYFSMNKNKRSSAIQDYIISEEAVNFQPAKYSKVAFTVG